MNKPASKRKSAEVDAYISLYPAPVRSKLTAVRQTVRKAAPEAEELISYRLPAYRFHGMLVYFAAFKQHIGLYPTASGVRAFKDELAGFKTSKGAIQFPLDRPLPLGLIAKIVRYRARENRSKTKQ
jgi:uncharacterized protein YdhG (YjbR/CyaY superfamily)